MSKPRVSDAELQKLVTEDWVYLKDTGNITNNLAFDLQDTRDELKTAIEHIEQAFGRNHTDTWWAVYKEKYGWDK